MLRARRKEWSRPLSRASTLSRLSKACSIRGDFRLVYRRHFFRLTFSAAGRKPPQAWQLTSRRQKSAVHARRKSLSALLAFVACVQCPRASSSQKSAAKAKNEGKKKVGGIRYEASSCERSSPDPMTFLSLQNVQMIKPTTAGKNGPERRLSFVILQDCATLVPWSTNTRQDERRRHNNQQNTCWRADW